MSGLPHTSSLQPSHSSEIESTERAFGGSNRREGKRQGQGTMQWYDSMTVYEGQWEDDIQVRNEFVLSVLIYLVSL